MKAALVGTAKARPALFSTRVTDHLRSIEGVLVTFQLVSALKALIKSLDQRPANPVSSDREADAPPKLRMRNIFASQGLCAPRAHHRNNRPTRTLPF